MRGLWLFIHVSGFVMWLGGGLASMIAGVTAKRFAPAERLAVYRAVAMVHKVLIRTGAVAAILSGFILAMPFFQAGGRLPPWLNMMIANGLLGFLALLFVSVPTASKLGALELDPRGELPENFARLRKRQVIWATLAGFFAILAVFSGTIVRN